VSVGQDRCAIASTLQLHPETRWYAHPTFGINRVSETATKHGGVSLFERRFMALYATSPHRQSLLGHFAPKINRFDEVFAATERVFSSVPDIAVKRRLKYKIMR
jgi:hypothetical protein